MVSSSIPRSPLPCWQTSLSNIARTLNPLHHHYHRPAHNPLFRLIAPESEELLLFSLPIHYPCFARAKLSDPAQGPCPPSICTYFRRPFFPTSLPSLSSNYHQPPQSFQAPTLPSPVGRQHQQVLFELLVYIVDPNKGRQEEKNKKKERRTIVFI